MKRWLIAAFVAGQLAILSPVGAEPLIQTVEQHRNDIGEIDRRDNVFVHRAAGYQFPGALGDMPARKTITFGPRDAEVYYTLLGGANHDPWLSLYVYPVTLGIAEEEGEVSTSLKKNFQGVEISPPAGISSAPKGAREQWYDASLQGVPAITGYRLVRDGDWYIKVRLTIPKQGGQSALDRAWKGLAAVPWSISARSAVDAPVPISTSTAQTSR